MQSVSCIKNVYNLAKNEAFRSELQDYKPFKKACKLVIEEERRTEHLLLD